MSIIELRVNMDCTGCQNKIRKALRKVEGVDDVDIDMDMQKVTVMGWADQHKVLNAVKKTGKTVEMWPYPSNPESYYNYYYQQPVVTPSQPATYYCAHGKSKSETRISSSTYENQQHHNYNYNEDSYGYYQSPPCWTMVDEQASSMFSDENPHACSIM